MRKRIPKILVTGGAGFIGSAFVRALFQRNCQPKRLSPKETVSEVVGGSRKLSLNYKVVVVDKLTYAGDLKRLQGLSPQTKGLSPKGTDPEVNARGTVPKLKFYKADICNKKMMDSIFKKEKPQMVVNFSAETHVDRSILDSKAFLKTNILGTQTLLDLSRKYKVEKFLHISTDECYGDIKEGRFNEDSPLRPNSPYAASKAAADLLIRSYIRTYGFPAIIVRPSNNYGPWQYPEKLIPLAILKALKNQEVPVYGKGQNVREWLFVSDCVEAILLILEKGRLGEIYNLGSGQEKKNIDVVKQTLGILGKPEGLIEFVKDRPGHDFRYSLNSKKIRDEFGWQPKIAFETGLKKAVHWYIDNKAWIGKHFSKKLSIKF